MPDEIIPEPILFYWKPQPDGTNGFYRTDFHAPEQIPVDAIEIAEEAWETYNAAPASFSFSPTGELVPIPPLTPEELEEIERNRPRTDAEKIVILQQQLSQTSSDLQALQEMILFP